MFKKVGDDKPLPRVDQSVSRDVEQRASKGGLLSGFRRFIPNFILKNVDSRIKSIKEKREDATLRNNINKSLPEFSNDRKIQSYLKNLTHRQLLALSKIVKDRTLRNELANCKSKEEFVEVFKSAIRVQGIKSKIYQVSKEANERASIVKFLIKNPNIIEKWEMLDDSNLKNLNLLNTIYEANQLLGNRTSSAHLHQLHELFLKNPSLIQPFSQYLTKAKELQSQRPHFNDEKKEELETAFLQCLLNKPSDSNDLVLFTKITDMISETTSRPNTQMLFQEMGIIYKTPEQLGVIGAKKIPVHRKEEDDILLTTESNYSFTLPEKDEDIVDLSITREILVSDSRKTEDIKEKTALHTEMMRHRLPVEGKMTAGQAKKLLGLFHYGGFEAPKKFEEKFNDLELSYENLPTVYKNKVDAYFPNDKEKEEAITEYFKMKANYYNDLSSSRNYAKYPDSIKKEIAALPNLDNEIRTAFIDNDFTKHNYIHYPQVEEFLDQKAEKYNEYSTMSYKELPEIAKKEIDQLFNPETKNKDDKAKLFFYMHFKAHRVKAESDYERLLADFNDTPTLTKGWNVRSHPLVEEFIHDSQNPQKALKAASLGNMYKLGDRYSLLPISTPIDEIVTVNPSTIDTIVNDSDRNIKTEISLPLRLENEKLISLPHRFEFEEVKMANENFLQFTTTITDANNVEYKRTVLYPMASEQEASKASSSPKQLTLDRLVSSQQLTRDILLAKSRFLFEKGYSE